MIRFGAGSGPHDRLLRRTADYARRIEAAGFPGIWVGDSLGRGRPTLDPLVELAALAAVTERVELGIGVLQLSLRHPIELAHRVQSVQALSGGRLRLGVGSGSTRADFELLGLDYDHRFRAMRIALETMHKVWRGEPVNGGTLSIWPGCEGGPPILMGAWRSPRWITYAAKECQGWTPVRPLQQLGRSRSRHEDLSRGRRRQRRPGQCRGRSRQPARIRRNSPRRPMWRWSVPPDEARRRLKRMEQLGFDEVLLVSQYGEFEELERARDLL